MKRTLKRQETLQKVYWKEKCNFMGKVEVEHRGRLTAEKFKELKDFLDKQGKFLGVNERFSIIYNCSKEGELNRSPIDLKLRITNKKTDLALKHGDWSGGDARKEFIFPVETEKFEEMVEFLRILGFFHGVLQATKTHLYEHRGVEVALVDVPGWGYYFEVEAVVDEDNIEKANKEIEEECQILGIEKLNDSDFCDLLKSLNDRPGYRFNFEKENFSKVKSRFTDYF